MAEKTLLIRGGTVVTHEFEFEADVLIRGERIQALGESLVAPPEAEVLEAAGLLVLPGVIDAHTHIQLDTGIYQTADDWYSGSRTAAFGGITTVVDFATQFPGQNFAEALALRREEAASAAIDYAFHMMVTDLPTGQEEELGALPELGIQSIKLYTTYRPNYYADDATLLRLLEAAGRYGLISLVHCENDALITAQIETLVAADRTRWRYHGASRPALAEQEATARVLFLAQAANAPVVIAHNSTGWTAMLVADARAEGQIAFSETTPQYLLLDSSRYTQRDPWRYILQPPLRPSSESGKLWSLVSEGKVDMIVTDHCDYTVAQKQAIDDFRHTPGGLPGMETLLPLMSTYGVEEGRISWHDLVRMLCVRPAQIYNLWPRKGTLIPGADADLVIFNPTGSHTITDDGLHTVGGYTPFAGFPVQGRVEATLRRGEFLVREGKFVGRRGGGRYLPRSPRFWN